MTQATAKRTIADELGDFTTTWRVIPISLLAIAIGLLSTGVAVVLLRLIALFTNLFFFQRWSTALVSPAGNHLGVFVVLVPVAGALVIGFMARYGSERIRGHGIPEAIESILINGSRVPPRLAILKPISSAISIGSGGPFGAEGPIIMTGGALGSMVAQFFHLTANERKTLLVAGAAAGMSATFAARRWRPCCWPSNCCCSSGSPAASCRSPSPAPLPARRAGTCSDSVRCFPCRITAWRCRRRRCLDAPWPAFSPAACQRC